MLEHPAILGLVVRLIVRGELRRAWRAFRRRVEIGLGIRRITPLPRGPWPALLVEVPELPRDTGGAYRPKWRPQDPAKDPREPFGGESSSRGTDHGWSNCTVTSGAVALAYQTAGRLALWGGDLRHAQGDLEGGTDLYDLRDAWAEYGEELKVKSGAGWSAVVDAHEAGRAIVCQGTGNVPGSGTFDGGHACCIGPETRASDGAWLWGDPTVTDWQWVGAGKIRDYLEAWQSSCAFAVSSPVAPPPDPDPPAPPPAPCYSQAELDAAVARTAAAEEAEAALELTLAGDELVGIWLDWLRAPRATTADAWSRGAWSDPLEDLVDELDGEDLDPCAPGAPARWARGPIPSPASDALAALLIPAAWDGSGWRAGAWRAQSETRSTSSSPAMRAR